MATPAGTVAMVPDLEPAPGARPGSWPGRLDRPTSLED